MLILPKNSLIKPRNPISFQMLMFFKVVKDCNSVFLKITGEINRKTLKNFIEKTFVFQVFQLLSPPNSSANFFLNF